MVETEQGENAIQIGRQNDTSKDTLTADEKAEAVMELAKAYQELESLAIEKNKVMVEFENRKEKLRQQIRLLSQKVKEGIQA